MSDSLDLQFQAPQQQDDYWMSQALDLAKEAAQQGEVPVGAIIVAPDESGHSVVIGKGANAPITTCDPTAHAEIMAMRMAAKTVGNYRLKDSTLYVSIEPCTMCFGAMIHARIARLVYAADEPKAGVISSNLSLPDSGIYNHRMALTSGVMAEESSALIKAFFRQRR